MTTLEEGTIMSNAEQAARAERLAEQYDATSKFHLSDMPEEEKDTPPDTLMLNDTEMASLTSTKWDSE
jgi:hypothetical protein